MHDTTPQSDRFTPLSVLHGSLLLADEDVFTARLNALRAELLAGRVGVLIEFLAEAVLMAVWRLRRAAQLEDQLGPGDIKAVRYQSMAERGFWKALGELRKAAVPVDADPRPR